MQHDLPERLPDGSWTVGGHVFETNAKAWRWLDREENQPVSRSEDLGDWIANKILRGA